MYVPLVLLSHLEGRGSLGKSDRVGDRLSPTNWGRRAQRDSLAVSDC